MNLPKLVITLYFILAIQPISCFSNSPIQGKDSLVISSIVNNFYSWYLGAINNKGTSAFMPEFVESENRMTTLDYSKYIQNLRDHHLSDALIDKEINSYSDCINNLGALKYSDYSTKFTDLDAHENLKCDFGNYYRWIGGQEPIYSIQVTGIEIKNNEEAIVEIGYLYSELSKEISGGNRIELERINMKWNISSIDSNKQLK